MRAWWNWEAMRAPPVADQASRARGSGRQGAGLLCRAKRPPGTATGRPGGFKRSHLGKRSDPAISHCRIEDTKEYAGVVELVDSVDLGSSAKACRFESCRPHQSKRHPERGVFCFGKQYRARTHHKDKCPVDTCCRQFANWWLPLFLPHPWGKNANRVLSPAGAHSAPLHP